MPKETNIFLDNIYMLVFSTQKIKRQMGKNNILNRQTLKKIRKRKFPFPSKLFREKYAKNSINVR